MWTETLIWQDRLVKCLDEVTWAMSAIGDHDNFDYAPEVFSPSDAVAGILAEEPVTMENHETPSVALLIEKAVKIDDERLIFVTEKERYFLLKGNPLGGGRIDELVPR